MIRRNATTRAERLAAGLLSCLLVAMSAFTAVIPGVSAAEDAAPSFVPADADWLTSVNYFREMAGLPPVTEDVRLSFGAAKHACYILHNGLTHDEEAGRPGYTREGDEAGRRSNVALSTKFGASSRSHIELWMTGPFHAVGVLRPNLRSTGFGRCDDEATPKWHSGAALDVRSGAVEPKPARTTPIVFPGDGTTTNLRQFIAETPDPRQFCGYPEGVSAQVGLPLIAMMPEEVLGDVTSTITGPTGLLETCTLSALNTNGGARSLLAEENTIVAIPRHPLSEGTYSVTMTSQSRTVRWSFTVDADAATVAALPTASPTGPAGGFDLLAPTRVVDTRTSLGATRLAANVVSTIRIAGSNGVPAGVAAVSANFTIDQPATAGFLTVWSCDAPRPTASTVNFSAGDSVSNAATVPLDAGGRLCVFSNVATDLVIDVNGSYGIDGAAGFTPIAPARVMDSRVPLGATGRLAAQQTVVLPIAGVPESASAVVLNVTSVDAGRRGFVTVYACDTERPDVSNLNPMPGRDRPSLVVAPVSAAGTVCLYTLAETDLVVDVTGYLAGRRDAGPTFDAGGLFTPTAPFRFVDTRDRHRLEMNGGTVGSRLQAGRTLRVPVAGRRGVASDATAVSLNLAVVDGDGSGFVTAWPCGDRPVASTANFTGATAVSNGAQLPLSADGDLCVFSNRSVHIVIDVNGWWS